MCIERTMAATHLLHLYRGAVADMFACPGRSIKKLHEQQRRSASVADFRYRAFVYVSLTRATARTMRVSLSALCVEECVRCVCVCVFGCAWVRAWVRTCVRVRK